MSRSNRARLRNQKKLKKIRMANDRADVRFAKMLLTGAKETCSSCVWLKKAAICLLSDDTMEYLLAETTQYDYPLRYCTCGNKNRFKKRSAIEAPLPEEKVCGFFQKRERLY